MAPAVAVESSTVVPTNPKTAKVVEELLQKLNISSGSETEYAAQNIASYANAATIEDLDTPAKLVADLKKQLANKKDNAGRERALVAIKAIAEQSLAPATEAYLVQLLGPVLACVGIPANKKAADAAAFAIIKKVKTNAIKAILPTIFNSVETSGKWQEKMTALELLNTLTRIAPSQLALRTPEAIPVISSAMWDTKKEVKAAATKTMENLCTLICNKDIDRFIPELIKCISAPENVPETVHLLGATTFVQDVQAPTLAIMVPLLERGLAERETAIKRKAAVIVDNMCKLVEDPQIVAPFLPKLMPGLQKNYDNIADPEARGVTLRGLETLKRVGDVKEDGKIPEVSTASEPKVLLETLKTVVSNTSHKDLVTKMEPVLYYLACIAGTFYDEGTNEQFVWNENLTPALTAIVGADDAKSITETFRKRAAPGIADAAEEEADDEEGEDLCNCTFNLAYGAKILLNQTHLRLKRGQRYGLCGPNGSGKSTLMRAINQEQVEGFPPKSEVKTVFVEHDLDAADTEESVMGWTMKKLAEAGVTVERAEIEKQMLDFGFAASQVDAPITSLSGGWRMKLALCRAVFESPDILLLDEPTNHLDVVNVKWLEDYLTNSKCTSIIVSHDSGFLDNVTQHIIHYERFKLKRYRGNLKAFVEKVPSAKSYYELGATEIQWKFPEPGFLEGVKTKAKAIVKMDKMEFQYPNTNKVQLSNITFQVSLGSRIAVIGPNGAGKSTLVNVLCGELIPTGGNVYVHENIRIAYIKQHAFQHIDNHLDMTPSEYIQWRFATGEDAETMDRVSKQVTEEDKQAMNKIFKIEGSQRRVISISGRRKFKNSYEYECSFTLGENVGQKNEKWTPMSSSDNAWISRSELIASHTKLVAEVDQKIAIESGSFRPLVRKEIEAHCENFGLDAELVSHSRMKGLSGGQRVKVCLAASTWLRPHLIVLDEPTNFLDRDSLGALSNALKSFEGGVVIITHSAEFTKGLTEEVWAVNNGMMTPSGHNWVQGQGSGPRLTEKEEGDQFDAMGNKLESKKKTKLTSSELRKKKKERMKKKKADPNYIDSDDEL